MCSRSYVLDSSTYDRAFRAGKISEAMLPCCTNEISFDMDFREKMKEFFHVMFDLFCCDLWTNADISKALYVVVKMLFVLRFSKRMC